MSTKHTRRSFLQRSTAAAGAAAAAMAWPAPFVVAASGDKLGVAVIGCGGMGGGNPGIAAGERFVAMCDIDDKFIAEAAKRIQDKVPNPKIYHDYRKMIDECQNQIDVVLIATPDHHHAPAAIRAMNLGKHAFVQKPLAHNIRECYELARVAREKKVLTGMGNQGYYGEGIRRVVEYIRAGAIGNVQEAHAILGRNFGGSGGRPPSKPVPAGLHWDEWLGPAPYRDYHDGLHPFSWRSWRQFGTGTIGDMACHNLSTLFWALRIGEVKKYTIECLNTKGGSEEMYPQDNVVRWEMPARGDMPPVKVFAYDHGGLMPEVMKDAQQKYERKFGEYTLFVGDKGLMGSDGYILPQSKHQETPQPPKTLPRAHGGPVGDLFHCIKNGGTPCSNFADDAGPLTAFSLTAHLAMFAGVGKKVEWDVEKMQCTNIPELNRLVRREYRKGWEV